MLVFSYLHLFNHLLSYLALFNGEILYLSLCNFMAAVDDTEVDSIMFKAEDWMEKL